jgi:hypothetical protein
MGSSEAQRARSAARRAMPSRLVDARAVRRIGTDSTDSSDPIGMFARHHAIVRSFVATFVSRDQAVRS